MNQKKDAKTIVFAVKMFSYWARNIFWFREFPKEIMIPIDSRLEKLFYKFWPHPNPLLWEERGYKEIKNFYKELSEKLNIPLLHLDAILWVNYDKLIK
jgi:DNA-(apurinic or apyrimidinic site) lyase